MTPIGMYFAQLAGSLVACGLLVIYLRRHLRRILVDLCRTEERARFWEAFATIFLVVLPLVVGLGYQPGATAGQPVFFDIASQVRLNLAVFLAALVPMALVISFFALITPKGRNDP